MMLGMMITIASIASNKWFSILVLESAEILLFLRPQCCLSMCDVICCYLPSCVGVRACVRLCVCVCLFVLMCV